MKKVIVILRKSLWEIRPEAPSEIRLRPSASVREKSIGRWESADFDFKSIANIYVRVMRRGPIEQSAGMDGGRPRRRRSGKLPRRLPPFATAASAVPKAKPLSALVGGKTICNPLMPQLELRRSLYL